MTTARATAVRALDASAARWRRTLTAASVEASALLSGRRLMVLAPHPDDETFGCGGLIARTRAAGAPVTIVVATDGRHSTRSGVVSPEALARLRAVELVTAAGHLGVPEADVLMLGWPDGALTAHLPRLAEQFAGLIAQRRPEVVLAPCAQDEHPDHRSVYEAAVRAVSRQPRPCLLAAYPVWTWAHAPWFLGTGGAARWCRRLGWSARQLVVGSWLRVGCGPHLAAKRAAVAAYASQTSNLTGEATWSFLPPEFTSLFLQPTELFQRVLPRPGRLR